MKTVKIYSTNYCPYCVKVKDFFSKKGVSFHEIDLTNDDDGLRRLVEATNWRTVPQVFIGDQFIGGCDDVLALDRKGELDQLLS